MDAHRIFAGGGGGKSKKGTPYEENTPPTLGFFF